MNAPDVLGPYRLGDLLGRGGMGSVYAGQHVKSGQQVAVKLIAAHVSDEMRFRRRFDAEIETLKRLRHENIVQLIGYGEEQGQLFYSMELVEGESLQKRIRREKRLDWLPTIEIAIQVCSALKHAHDIGVIHRDLKPANLIMTERDQVKLVDFGIAKIFGSSEQTAAGSVLGTADYMAPEQARNEGITTRTDLYALGSVMYAMLTGRPPFKGKNITEVIEKLKRDDPVPLDMVNPDLPEAVVSLVHDLLRKDAGERPPTALAVMNRLKAMRAGLQRERTVDGHVAKTQVKRGSGTAVMLGTPDQSATPANPSARTMHQPGLAPKDQTIEDPSVGATQKREAVDESDQLDKAELETRTHFQTVDHSPAGSKVFSSVGDQEENSLVKALSVTLLIALLVGIIYMAATTMRGPTASGLYNEILAKQNEPEVKQLIDQYLKLFPEHPKAPEVRDMQTRYELEAVVRRLRLKRKLGIEPLTEEEEAFLEAMELRGPDLTKAKQRLEDWLVLFGEDSSAEPDTISNNPPSEQRKQMEKFVRFELRVLDAPTAVKLLDPRLERLQQRIDNSGDAPPEERRKVLESVIELYQDKEWAKPVVQEAKVQLEQL